MLHGLGLLNKGVADTVQKAWQANPSVRAGLHLVNFQEQFLPPLYNHYINEQPFLSEVLGNFLFLFTYLFTYSPLG